MLKFCSQTGASWIRFCNFRKHLNVFDIHACMLTTYNCMKHCPDTKTGQIITHSLVNLSKLWLTSHIVSVKFFASPPSETSVKSENDAMFHVSGEPQSPFFELSQTFCSTRFLHSGTLVRQFHSPQ